MEEWKDIAGYEGLYQVSNLGRVKSLERRTYNPIHGSILLKERIMKNCECKGYYQVRLTKNGVGKLHLVHRLVAIAFIPNPSGLPFVNHKDETRTNNSVENLEWCTMEYNFNYGTARDRCVANNINNKKKSKPVLCEDLGIIYPSIKEAERKTGIRHQHISDACKFKKGYKTVGGYKWSYVK